MFSQTILFTKNHRQITKIVIGRLFKIDNVKPVFPDDCEVLSMVSEICLMKFSNRLFYFISIIMKTILLKLKAIQ